MTGIVLVKFEAAKRALAEAKTIDEVKDIRDKAEALRLYMKQASESLEMQNACAEIKLRAERRIGEMLAETVKPGNPQFFHDARIGKLPEGISHTQSHRWQAVARLPEEIFEAHITQVKAKREELTTAEMLRLAKEIESKQESEERRQRQQDKLPTLEALGKYRAIMIDPPWHYDDQGSRIGASQHYETMPLEQIASLPIVNLAAEDGCHLYLWTTNSFMREAYTLLDAWGLEAKTVITWVKTTQNGQINFGMGHYFRNATEHILFATRGSLPTLRDDEPNVILAPRNHHSAKPDKAYALVERMSPQPYLEIFSRRDRPKWTVWGNEVTPGRIAGITQ